MNKPKCVNYLICMKQEEPKKDCRNNPCSHGYKFWAKNQNFKCGLTINNLTERGDKKMNKGKEFMVEVVTTVVNEKKHVTYDGKSYIDRALRLAFKTQGELYEKVFGVSKEDAEAAGWYPGSDSFNSESMGFERFLEAKGKITKTVKTEMVDVRELLFPIFSK